MSKLLETNEFVCCVTCGFFMGMDDFTICYANGSLYTDGRKQRCAYPVCKNCKYCPGCEDRLHEKKKLLRKFLNNKDFNPGPQRNKAIDELKHDLTNLFRVLA
jgi:hypothetical protein